MPLLPVSTWGAKLWVEIDGCAQDKVNWYAIASLLLLLLLLLL